MCSDNKQKLREMRKGKESVNSIWERTGEDRRHKIEELLTL